MLQTQLTSEVDKYLQEVAERHERDINYFDGWHMAMNTTSQQQKANFAEYEAEKIPELIYHDTGMNGEINAEHYVGHHEELETILEESDEEQSMTERDDIDEVDTIAYTPEESDDEPFNMAIDDTSEDPTIVMGKPITTAFVSADVRVPTEKVGCLQVTSQLKEFLKHYPPESREKAFEQIYQILQTLHAYLIDNDDMPYDRDDDDMPYDKDDDDMPYDKDNDDMPYYKDNDDMPDENENEQMPDNYADDNEMAMTEMKYDRNMTNDELKEVGTKDMVLHKRDDKMTIRVKWPIEANHIDDEFMREYDDMHKSMEYRQVNDYYKAQRHIQSTMKGDTPVKTVKT